LLLEVKLETNTREDSLAHELDVLHDDSLVLFVLVTLLFENEELIAELLVHYKNFTTDDGYKLLVIRLLHGNDLTGLSSLRLNQFDGELLILFVGF
jgi:hypothetical protein